MIKLEYTKQFVSGMLVGLTYEETIVMADQASALAWQDRNKKHKEIPVKAIGGNNYLITDIKITYLN